MASYLGWVDKEGMKIIAREENVGGVWWLYCARWLVLSVALHPSFRLSLLSVGRMESESCVTVSRDAWSSLVQSLEAYEGICACFSFFPGTSSTWQATVTMMSQSLRASTLWTMPLPGSPNRV